MRLRVPELLAERGMTAYRLSKESGGRISLTAAYRLARGEFAAVSAEVLDALCDVFEIEDVGPLFVRERQKKGAKPAGGRRSVRRD